MSWALEVLKDPQVILMCKPHYHVPVEILGDSKEKQSLVEKLRSFHGRVLEIQLNGED